MGGACASIRAGQQKRTSAEEREGEFHARQCSLPRGRRSGARRWRIRRDALSLRIRIDHRPAQRGQVHAAECAAGTEARDRDPQAANHAHPHPRRAGGAAEEEGEGRARPSRGAGGAGGYARRAQAGDAAGPAHDAGGAGRAGVARRGTVSRRRDPPAGEGGGYRRDDEGHRPHGDERGGGRLRAVAGQAARLPGDPGAEQDRCGAQAGTAAADCVLERAACLCRCGADLGAQEGGAGSAAGQDRRGAAGGPAVLSARPGDRPAGAISWWPS